MILGRVLTIEKVDCSFNDHHCPQEISDIFARAQNKNFLTLNRKELTWAVEQLLPFESIKINFSFPNILIVGLKGTKDPLSLDIFQVSELPRLSMDTFSASTESGQWRRPVVEITDFLNGQTGTTQKIWENGSLTAASSSSSIFFLYSALPDKDQLTALYHLLVLVNRYLENPGIYIVGDRLFLSVAGLPDIIINTHTPLDHVAASLQSIDYLATIKKDARVINLSFKNPVVK